MKWIRTSNKLNVFTDGQSFHLDKKDPLYKKVLNSLNSGKLEKAGNLLNVAKKVMNYTNNYFRVNAGKVFLRGEDKPVHDLIASKLIEFSRNGLPYKAIVEFTRNLIQNPSEASQDQLYGCLSQNKHPITSDGMFIAYKRVDKNSDGQLVDNRTGQFINNIGQVVTMKRSEVDPDPTETCSTGLHVASWEYAQNYAGTVLLTVLVNPRDVVAVPRDYNNQKMRVCQYEVIGIQNDEIKKIYIPNSVVFNRTREALKQNEGFSFNDMTAPQIVSFVKNIAGEEINYNLRSKISIVRKAEEIFIEKNLLAEKPLEELQVA